MNLFMDLKNVTEEKIMRKNKERIRAVGVTVLLLACFLLWGMPVNAEEISPVKNYTGIAIDGDFSDWDGVTKYSVETEGLDYSAFVYDGDMMYFYFEFHENNNRITWAGPGSNGKFVVINNYGQQMLFQLMPDENGRVAGVEGASFAANTTTWMGNDFQYKWEIAIPAANLHDYTYEGKNDLLTFGFYGGEMIVTDLGNVSADPDEAPAPVVPAPASGTIKIDGQYDDWNYMPVTKIEYSTPGTSENIVDSEGAVYLEDVFYAYVKTTYPPYLQTAGGNFDWFQVKLNDNPAYAFSPLFVTADANGNINWSTKVGNLPEGTHEFYLFDHSTGRNIQNITEAGDYGNVLYGKAYITIGPSMNRMEYYLDTEKLAAKYGLSANEVKMVSVYYDELGTTWLTTAGTSTAPFLGIALCLGVTGIVLLRKKQKGVVQD